MMQKIKNPRILDMTKGSPASLLLRFSLPLFFGNLLQQFYNLADTSIAGHMLGYPAVCICEPVTWVICFFFISGAVLLCRKNFRK